MTRATSCLLLLPLFVAGCSKQAPNAPPAGPSQTAGAGAPSADPSAGAAGQVDAGQPPAPDAGEVAGAHQTEIPLSHANTKIQFVGTHTGEKPDPRIGEFGSLQGKAVLEGDQLVAVNVDIDTSSLSTEIDKLTNHLKSPDFFDVRQNPKATFKSTAIEPGRYGAVTVSGDLTLLGATKSISFPANVTTDGGLQLNAEFTIDRMEFGMDFGPDKVEKLVTMKVRVGGEP